MGYKFIYLDTATVYAMPQTGESVEARYTEDDKWYKAVILQVIHGGFEIARCELNYDMLNMTTHFWQEYVGKGVRLCTRFCALAYFHPFGTISSVFPHRRVEQTCTREVHTDTSVLSV